MAETKAELERKIAELERALRTKAKFESSIAQAELGTSYTMVPIKNYGNTLVTLEFEYKGMKKNLVLGTKDPQNLGAIPLEFWVELERTNKLVTDGYIARTDIPNSNPNVIESDEEFIRSHGEVEFAKKVSEMTNAHVLLRLLKAVEFQKIKSGKYLAAANALKQRIFDVTETYETLEDGTQRSLNTGIRVVEEEE